MSKTFNVVMSLTYVSIDSVEVEAETQEEAEAIAKQMAEDGEVYFEVDKHSANWDSLSVLEVEEYEDEEVAA